MEKSLLNCHYILSRDGRLIIRRFAVSGLLAVLLSVSLSSPLLAIGSVRGSAISPDLYALGSGGVSKTKTDPCLAMLQRVKQTIEHAPSQAKENISKQHNSMPVTLSYLMGVRYVVGPKEMMAPNHANTIAQMNDKQLHASAIAGYRACKKQLALRNK